MIKKLRRLVTHFFDRFPRQLPHLGTTDFQEFCDSIFESYGIPAEKSYVQAIATMILHLGPSTDKAPKLFFVRSIRKAMANQIAYAAIDKIREEDKAKAHEEAVRLANDIVKTSIPIATEEPDIKN